MLTPETIIKKLKPCHYKYNSNLDLDNGKINFGFIAQDILESFGEDYNFVTKDPNSEYYKVNYFQFIAPLVSIVQKQQEEIEKLKIQINELKGIKND